MNAEEIRKLIIKQERLKTERFYADRETNFNEVSFIYFNLEKISRSLNGTYILNIIRKDLNEWYNNLPDEEKLKLELGDDYE